MTTTTQNPSNEPVDAKVSYLEMTRRVNRTLEDIEFKKMLVQRIQSGDGDGSLSAGALIEEIGELIERVSSMRRRISEVDGNVRSLGATAFEYERMANFLAKLETGGGCSMVKNSEGVRSTAADIASVRTRVLMLANAHRSEAERITIEAEV